MNIFNKKPMCEICKKKEAISFSLQSEWQGSPSNYKHTGKWQFTCECNEKKEHRHIVIEDFFKSPSETVDQLAHYHGKEIMNWDNFMDMMIRFRKEINGY